MVGAGGIRPCHADHLASSEMQQAVTVPGVIGPLEVVTQVHASGDNVRYAILAPMAPKFFTIDESEWSGGNPQGHPFRIPVPGARPCFVLQ